MIVKIKEKATELIELLDDYESDLTRNGEDGSQVFMAWFRAKSMMSNINKHYEKFKNVVRVSEEDKTENIS